MKKLKYFIQFLVTPFLISVFIFLKAEQLFAQNCNQIEIQYQQSGCVAPVSVKPREGDLPIAAAACVNQPYIYSTNGTGGTNDSFLWEVTGPAFVLFNPNNTSQSISIIWPQSGVYTLLLLVDDGFGNSYTSSIIVNVKETPVADFTFNPSNACVSSDIIFDNNTSYSGEAVYLWNFGDNTFSDDENPIHRYSVAGNYDVMLIASSFELTIDTICQNPDKCDTIRSIKTCCADTIIHTVTVMAGNISIDCISTVCSEDTATYTASGCSNVNWLQPVGGNTISATGNQITIAWGNGSNQGEIQAQCDNGCIASVNVPIIPSNPIPEGNQNPCKTSIESYTLPLLPGTFYTWHLTNSSNVDFSSLLNTYPDNNTVWINWNSLPVGSYTLSVKLNNEHLCCESQGQITIDVKLPFTLSPNQPICEGTQFNLSVIPNAGTFHWQILNSSGTEILTGTGSPFSLSINDPGNYIAIAEETSGIYCNTTQQVSITVIDVQAPGTIEGPAVICPGSSYSYSMSSPAPDGYHYKWQIPASSGTFQPGTNLTTTSGNNVNIEWINPTTISVVLLRNSNPQCQSSPVTLNVNQGVIGTISGTQTVCADNEIVYTLSDNSLPSNEIINWEINPSQLGTITSGQGSNTVHIHWHGNGPTANIIATSNCGTTLNYPVTISIPASGNILKEGNDFCSNVTLKTEDTGSGYNWFLNGQPFPGNSYSVPITQGGTYVVTYTNTSGCDITATLNVPDTDDCQLLITTPGPTVYCSGQSINTPLIASFGQGCSGYVYQWYFNGNPIANAISGTYIANAIGNYYVKATKGICTETSQTIKITQDSCGGCTCQSPQTETFSTSQTISCNSVNFNTSYNDVTWHFGDGYSSNDENTNHFYQNPGYYLVQLSVPCENNCVQLFQDTVFIPIAPNFSFDIDCNTVQFQDLSQIFNNVGNITGYSWNFGDGSPVSTIQNPDHVYNLPGSYNVSLTTMYSNQALNLTCSSTINQSVNITAPGIPSINMNPSPVCANVPTTFSTSTFSTSTVNMLSYVWDFGDGSFGYNESVPHAYSTAGNYIVTLTVSDFYGCIARDTINITVKEGINNCHVEPAFICTGGMATLHALGGFSSYQWQQQSGGNFVNIGVNDSLLVVNQPGTYQVIITNQNGCSCTSNLAEVKEVEAPKAIINANPTYLCGGGSVNLSSPNIPGYTYQWFKNNVAFCYGSNCNQYFYFPNSPQIKLVVTNEYGCKDSCEFLYQVYPIPNAPIITPNSTLCEGVPINLNVSNYSDNITWNNGTIGSSITVTTAGTYTATFTDPITGCTNQSSVIVNRKPPLELFPHECDTIPCTCRNDDDSFTIYAPKPLVGALQEDYTIKWYNANNSTIVIQQGTSLTLPSGTTGTYFIIATNNITQCWERSNDYSIVVPLCNNCDCSGSHFTNLTWSYINGPKMLYIYKCRDRIRQIDCNHPVQFNAGFECNPESCNQVVTYSLVNNSGLTQSGNMPFKTTGLSAGYYTLQMYGKCNGIVCDTCAITFEIICPETPCCPQLNQIGIQDTNKVNLSQQSVNGHDYSLYTTQVVLTGGNTPYTEIRATVVDFELTANYGDCIDCANYPFTFASLSATALAGIQPVLTLPTSDPGYQVTSNIYGNPREVVWSNNGGLIDLSIPQSTILSFYLPPESSIPCCGLKAKICVKFSLYDINCNLCEIVKCYEVVIGDTTLSESCCCENWSGRPVYLSLRSNVQNDSERADQKINPIPTPIFIGWAVRCGEVKYLSKGTYSISAPEFYCSPASCNVTYSWIVGGSQGGQVYGSGSGRTFTHNFSTPGTYTITITPKCGSCFCLPCTFDVIIGKKVSPSVPLPSTSENNYGINDEGIKRTVAPGDNDYGINDEGIKRTTSQTFTSVNNYGINDEGIKAIGEPVNGAEIYIELEPFDEDPIANVTTDENGEFYFETATIPNFPTQGTFKLTVSPSKAFAISKKIPIKKHNIKVKFKTPKNGKFQFILFWVPEEDPDKAENKGAFAVSGKNST